MENEIITNAFLAIFPDHTITITYRDDETIVVHVARDAVCNATFEMNVGSDDDVYHFVDVDHNFPDVIFDTGY